MSLIDLIRGKSRTVATVAGIAVATPPDRETVPPTVATVARIAVATSQEPPTDTTGIVSAIEEIIINSSFATAIPAIPATDPASLNPVSLEQLPPALIDAATRVCRELHNDPPEAVAAMLEDLRHYPADSWPWLIDHFTAQLPSLPAITADPPASRRPVTTTRVKTRDFSYDPFTQ